MDDREPTGNPEIHDYDLDKRDSVFGLDSLETIQNRECKYEIHCSLCSQSLTIKRMSKGSVNHTIKVVFVVRPCACKQDNR